MPTVSDVVVVPAIGCACCSNSEAAQLSTEHGVVVCDEACLNDYLAGDVAAAVEAEQQIQLLQNPQTQTLVVVVSAPIGITLHRRSAGEKALLRQRREAAEARRLEEEKARLAKARAKTGKAEAKGNPVPPVAMEDEFIEDVDRPVFHRRSAAEKDLLRQRREAAEARRLEEEKARLAKQRGKTQKAEEKSGQTTSSDGEYSVQAILQSNGVVLPNLTSNLLSAHQSALHVETEVGAKVLSIAVKALAALEQANALTVDALLPRQGDRKRDASQLLRITDAYHQILVDLFFAKEGKVNPKDEKTFIESLEDLVYVNDPDRETWTLKDKLAKFAKKLIKYAVEQKEAQAWAKAPKYFNVSKLSKLAAQWSVWKRKTTPAARAYIAEAFQIYFNSLLHIAYAWVQGGEEGDRLRIELDKAADAISVGLSGKSFAKRMPSSSKGLADSLQM